MQLGLLHCLFLICALFGSYCCFGSLKFEPLCGRSGLAGCLDVNSCLAVHRQEEGRLPGWEDGLRRSFVHDSTPSLQKREEGAKRLAMASLGPSCLGVRLMRLRGTLGGAVECPKGPASRMGDCWSRGQKVSLLLELAQVECRLSSAPPVSMHVVLVSMATKAIGIKAHCL